MIKIILIGLLWPFCVFAGEMEDNKRALGKREMMDRYHKAREKYRKAKARKRVTNGGGLERGVTNGGGLAFDSVITTKVGVKAQRFQGVLFEANPSGLGGGSSGSTF